MALHTSTVRKVARLFTEFRQRLVVRVSKANVTTSDAVSRAVQSLNQIMEAARNYAKDSEDTMAHLHGSAGLGALLSQRSELLRDYSTDMTSRAAAQDERARSAALTARTIAELAIFIERLAAETRLLAINARMESSRLGMNSSGFSVLAAEMKRLSDEVARTSERVSDLAGLLAQSLPSMAEHARDVRSILQDFSATAARYLDETERAVKELRELVSRVTGTGRTVIVELMRVSHQALTHLQFQDVVAQDLRRLDGEAWQAQLEFLRQLEADPSVLAEVPVAEYPALG